jgi:DNA-binding HxlR family transcriptional regulator
MSRHVSTSGPQDVQNAIFIIKGKWRSAIITCLIHGEKRFNDLRRDLGTITPKTLIKELKVLQEHELLVRYKTSDNSKAVIYKLTSKGTSLYPLLDQIVIWNKNKR